MFSDIVRKGLALLSSEQGYGQSNVVQKLHVLQFQVSTSSFSNIANSKSVGLKVLKTAAEGIQAVIKHELGMEYKEETSAFQVARGSNWQPYIVPETDKPQEEASKMTFRGEGRVSIQHKTEFMDSAQKEVIELGIRLKTFAGYFTSRNEQEYKSHIINLLKRGVHFKVYMLDPDSQEARLYFEDRQRVEPLEKEAIGDAKKVIERLIMLVKEFEQMQQPGNFEIYLYRHVPYNHFLAVDINAPNGKMMVSHYIYGVRRAECPVLEFSRTSYPALYKKYEDSLRLYVKDARKLQ